MLCDLLTTPVTRFPGYKSVFRDRDTEDLVLRRGRTYRRWRRWHEAGLRSYAAVQVPGVQDLVRRLQRMNRWRQMTDELFAEMAAKARTFLELADWHAGKAGDPPFPQEKGRNPKVAAAYFRATGEVVRSLTLAGVRLQELQAEEEKRAKAAAFAAESARRLEEWEEKTRPK